LNADDADAADFADQKTSERPPNLRPGRILWFAKRRAKGVSNKTPP
jgi:hypothetical protein